MHLERGKGKLIGEFGCMCVYVHASVGVHMCVVCVRVLCGEKHSCVTRFDDKSGIVV